jgi:hypothetical protein
MKLRLLSFLPSKTYLTVPDAFQARLFPSLGGAAQLGQDYLPTTLNRWNQETPRCKNNPQRRNTQVDKSELVNFYNLLGLADRVGAVSLLRDKLLQPRLVGILVFNYTGSLKPRMCFEVGMVGAIQMGGFTGLPFVSHRQLSLSKCPHTLPIS